MKKMISLAASLLAVIVIASFTVSASAESVKNSAQTASTTSAVSSTTTLKKKNTTVEVLDKNIYYDGTPKTPQVKVVCGGKKLKIDSDYTVEYSDNLVAGKAGITITGIGSYSGTLSKSFTIKTLSIAEKGKTSVDVDADSLVYNNKPVCPSINVVYNNGTEAPLIEGIDYTVEYSNNSKIGRGKAEIRGIGNYSGKLTKYYKIIPKQVPKLSVSSITTSCVTLKWQKVDVSVTGYQILLIDLKSGSYSNVAMIGSSNDSYTVSNLSANKAYSYVVRAYKNVDNINYYGSYSAPVTTSVRPASVIVTAVTKDGSNLIVDWEKVDCSGYEIFYSPDKNMKKNVKKLAVSSKKNTRKIKGVSKDSTYYVKIRAYTKVNGKKYYGEKSAIVSSYFSNVYATYYSYYENNPNRTNNLRIASKAISGTIIQPGETFSFNAVVGPRTAAKGYKAAHVFKDSSTVTTEIGGGICQVASTMFNCVLRANFQIVERHQHSQRVAYVPLGRDAAIYGSANNLRWKNNSKYAVKIEMEVKDGKISCTFYTCKKAKPKKVDINVTQNGRTFTLKRVVDGKTNYTCRSNY